MKTTIKKISHAILILMIATSTGTAFAQRIKKVTIAVLNIESSGIIPDAQTTGNMVRLELEKTNSYNVMDAYDVADILIRNNIDVKTCFGKSCVIAAGKALNADKMILGNAERMGEKIAITLKIVDVKNGEIEKTITDEYLNLQEEIQKMIEISVKKLAGIVPDQNNMNMLIAFDQPIESPRTKMNMSGPRIGGVMTTGDAGKLLRAPESVGGFNMYNVSSQIGWQQEVQYLSSGNFSALLEFIAMAGGIESGRFIPSFSGLLGFRLGRQGWEFAIGPSFKIIRKADGYYDSTRTWHLEENVYNINGYPSSHHIVSRLDSRGAPAFSGGLVLAFGRTFKSGYLNIPVNAYVVPRKEGWTYGLSFGFNIYKK